MHRTLVIILLFAYLFIFTCTRPTEPNPSLFTVSAFISDTMITEPTIDDSIHLAICDTIHPDDTVFFLGFFHPKDNRVRSWEWVFGDGESSSDSLTFHTYKNGGIYKAIFIVEFDSSKILMDTVTIHVNTPPDSVVLLTPQDNAKDQSSTPLLSWKGFDRDDFDANLLYTLVIIR